MSIVQHVPVVRTARIAVVTGLVLLGAPPSGAGAEAPLFSASKAGAVAGRYIVVMKNGAGGAGADRVENLTRAKGGKVTRQYREALTGFTGTMSAATLADVRSDADVAYVERDVVLHGTTVQTISDPDLWGLDRIDQPSLPLNQTYDYTTTSQPVTAYVIDSGIRTTHVDFGGRAAQGFDAIDPGGPHDDCSGHGTHVAGTLGGTLVGVAKNVHLVAVRVLGCDDEGTASEVIAGIDWVTSDHAPGAPAVANMSLGGEFSTAVDDAVSNSITDGVTYVAAAGNDGGDACVDSPARVPAVLTVGASTITDQRASFSDIGPCVDLFAPGKGILSTFNTSDTAAAVADGTSAASPHVAGVAALYLEAVPSATPATVAAAITGGASVDKLTDVGAGSPNRLLYSLLGTATTPAPLPPAPGTPGTSPSQITVVAPGGSSSATSSSTSSSISGSGRTTSSRSQSGQSFSATSLRPWITSLSARRVSGGVQVRMQIKKGARVRVDFLKRRAGGSLGHHSVVGAGSAQVMRMTGVASRATSAS